MLSLLSMMECGTRPVSCEITAPTSPPSVASALKLRGGTSWSGRLGPCWIPTGVGRPRAFRRR